MADVITSPAPDGVLWPVLSIKQPYVSRIMQGDKTVENRSWTTYHLGRLYIHAAKTVAPHHGFGLTDGDLEPVRVRGQVDPVRRDRVYGAIVGYVDLVGMVTDSDHWSAMDGYYHWLLENPVEFDEAIPVNGRASLWRYTPGAH